MAENPEHIPKYQSETSKHRDVILPFCIGYGLDIGFGGDAINSAAIRMDFSEPYAHTGDSPVQLGGDCRNLKWLANDNLDYVYSSHVLEDFDRNETQPVLAEWIRVVKPGGLIVLLQPDQKRYVESCLRRGEVSADGIVGNPHHSIADFSADYVLQVAQRIGGVEKFRLIEELGEYSFLLVLKKTKPTSRSGDKITELNETLERTYRERDHLKETLKEAERKIAAYQKNTIIKQVLRRIKRMF